MFHALNGWRFIFALMIVWHHLPIPKPLDADLGNPIVTFFFVLSGFLLTLSYRDKLLDGRVTSKDFIVKRSATIFPLQWFFTILFVVCSINVVSEWAIPFHLTLSQSLIPLWEINFTLNTPSWFLSSLFFCYLITPIIIKTVKSRSVYCVLFILAVASWHVFLYFLPDDIGRRWLCYINPIARLQDYGAGILLALYWSEISANFRKLFGTSKILYTVIECVAIFLVFISLFRQPFPQVSQYLGVGSVLLDCFLCLFLAVFTLGGGLVSRVLSFPIFGKLGKIAITIFMSHGFVLNFAKPIYNQSVFLYIVIVYGVTIMISFLLERYYCSYTKQAILRLFSKK